MEIGVANTVARITGTCVVSESIVSKELVTYTINHQRIRILKSSFVTCSLLRCSVD